MSLTVDSFFQKWTGETMPKFCTEFFSRPDRCILPKSNFKNIRFEDYSHFYMISPSQPPERIPCAKFVSFCDLRQPTKNLETSQTQAATRMNSMCQVCQLLWPSTAYKKLGNQSDTDSLRKCHQQQMIGYRVRFSVWFWYKTSLRGLSIIDFIMDSMRPNNLNFCRSLTTF